MVGKQPVPHRRPQNQTRIIPKAGKYRDFLEWVWALWWASLEFWYSPNAAPFHNIPLWFSWDFWETKNNLKRKIQIFVFFPSSHVGIKKMSLNWEGKKKSIQNWITKPNSHQTERYRGFIVYLISQCNLFHGSPEQLKQNPPFGLRETKKNIKEKKMRVGLSRF